MPRSRGRTRSSGARRRDEAIEQARQRGYEKGFEAALSVEQDALEEAEREGYERGYADGHRLPEDTPVDDYDAGFQDGVAAANRVYRKAIADALGALPPL